MDINWKSPLAVLKAVGVFLALTAASALVLTVVAMGADMASPGLGARVKSWFRIA